MMKTTTVGGYPKIPAQGPAKLRTALARMDRGDVSPEQLSQVEDEVTLEVMHEQADAGIDLINDGLVRWFDEVTYIAGRLGGVELSGLTRYFDTNTYFRRPVVEGPLRWESPLTLDDYRFAVAHSSRPVKPVLTGPYTLARLSDDRFYNDFEALLLAYTEALHQEARGLAALNPPVIQFNEPALTRHPEDAALAARAWRRLLDSLPVESAVHFYFGRPDGLVGPAIDAGFTTVGVDATIDGVLDAVAAGPRPSKLAAGVVDARTTRLEPEAIVRERIRHAADIAGSDNLYVGPNMGLEYLPRDHARAKLERLAAVTNDLKGEQA